MPVHQGFKTCSNLWHLPLRPVCLVSSAWKRVLHIKVKLQGQTLYSACHHKQILGEISSVHSSCWHQITSPCDSHIKQTNNTITSSGVQHVVGIKALLSMHEVAADELNLGDIFSTVILTAFSNTCNSHYLFYGERIPRCGRYTPGKCVSAGTHTNTRSHRHYHTLYTHTVTGDSVETKYGMITEA